MRKKAKCSHCAHAWNMDYKKKPNEIGPGGYSEGGNWQYQAEKCLNRPKTLTFVRNSSGEAERA